MDNCISPEKIQVAAGICLFETLIRSLMKDTVENVSKIHPMLNLYFDSELNSELEQQTILALADSVLWTTDVLAGNRESLQHIREFGVFVAHQLDGKLYVAKLLHHANTGRIDKEELFRRMSEFLSVHYASLVIELWDVVGVQFPKYLSNSIVPALIALGVDENTANYTSEIIEAVSDYAFKWVRNKLTDENIRRLFYYTFKYTITSLDMVLKTADNFSQYYQETKSKILSWGRYFCQQLGWETLDSLENEEDGKADKDTSGIEDKTEIDDEVMENDDESFENDDEITEGDDEVISKDHHCRNSDVIITDDIVKER